MSLSNSEGIRNRKIFSSEHGPPVPPKSDRSPYVIASKHDLQPSKPLPPVPGIRQMKNSDTKNLTAKPLPQPPIGVNAKSVSLWIAGFVIWFLLIVILLPVITEKDAMPGFNRWLRNLWSSN
ncbi:hypothetical protein GQ44DRAFT_726465 [Phaeosphaeriaceae sp. PMI808]|nr:hypothetical protein GQ44DRAFT_726465 [Phaeosphaeriaceae sp. PMI808]